MAFIKLDTGIIRSTIWFDRPALEIFITALLLAEPKEYDTPIPQLRVGALEETGWQAPPGWYGFVPASGPGLIAAAQIEQEPGMVALRKMGEPEPESRSQDFEGRRLIRIDGGYLLLNYVKYRDKDHTTAERSARYRERKRHTVTPSRHTVTGRDVTHADADADADADAMSKEGERDTAPRARKRRTLWHSVPEGWEPKDKHRLRAKHWPAGLFDRELDKFRAHEFTAGKSDADRTFMSWLLRAETTLKLPLPPKPKAKPIW